MFDVNSQEKEAHHQFMSLSPDQQAQISNQALFGQAAAYHAAVAFTDHCEKNGLPENATEAKSLLFGYASGFVNREIDGKGMKLDKAQAMQYAAQSLMPKLTTTNPEDWKIVHTTPTKAFDNWKNTAKGNSSWGSIDSSELQKLGWAK